PQGREHGLSVLIPVVHFGCWHIANNVLAASRVRYGVDLSGAPHLGERAGPARLGRCSSRGRMTSCCPGADLRNGYQASELDHWVPAKAGTHAASSQPPQNRSRPSPGSIGDTTAAERGATAI